MILPGVAAFALAGLDYETVVDAAIGGGDSVQSRAILQRDFISSDVAIYASGMNDVYAREWSAETIIESDRATLDYLRGRVTRLVIMSIPPRASSAVAWTAEKFSVWLAVNAWRQQYAQQTGVQYIDTAAASLSDARYSDALDDYAGPFLSGASLTSSDGVHPASQRGGLTLAGPLSEILGKWFPSPVRSPHLPSNGIADASNLVTNPMMIFDAGGTTSGTATFQDLAGTGSAEVADSWEVVAESGTSLTIKCGVVPRTTSVHGDTCGNSQRIIVTNGGATNSTVRLRTASIHGSLSDGDEVEIGAVINVSSAASPGTGDSDAIAVGVSAFIQQATAVNGAIDAWASNLTTGTLPNALISPTWRGRTRRISSAGAFTSARPLLTLVVPAGGDACIDIGRVVFRRSE